MNIAGKSLDENSFLFIEGGEYSIGIDEKDIPDSITDVGLKRAYFEASSPRQRCTLRPCAVGKFFVSAAEFARFVRATGFITDAEKEGWGWILRDGQWRKVEGLCWQKPFGNDADELYHDQASFVPALQVSWNDAAAYCRWLSGACGNNVYLPTEVQWESYALQIGVPSLSDIFRNNGTFVQSAYLYDMDYLAAIRSRTDDAGNLYPGVLWEWCDDWYEAYPGGPSNREFGKVYKVLRGGSLHSLPVQRAREYRFRRCPTARSAYYGFRIVVEL